MKKLLFSAYRWYVAKMPFSLGKGFLRRLCGARGGLARYVCNGVEMELNPASEIDSWLINGTAFNDLLMERIRVKLHPEDIYLDIGANIGYFAIHAAKATGCYTLCFEPSPRELARLHRNISLNGAINVIVFPFGLAREEKEVGLKLWDMSNPGNNHVVRAGEEGALATRVFRLDQAITADLARRVRLVKIDVEGYEMEVLRGMESLMGLFGDAEFVVEIFPEMLRKANAHPNDIYEFFERYGYGYRHGNQGEHWDELFTKAPDKPGGSEHSLCPA